MSKTVHFLLATQLMFYASSGCASAHRSPQSASTASNAATTTATSRKTSLAPEEERAIGGSGHGPPTTQMAKSHSRLSYFEQQILVVQQDYLKSEGAEHSGEKFANLIGIVEQAMHGNRLDLRSFELFALVGFPDYVQETPRDTWYVYTYDRFGHQDWYTMFHESHAGILKWEGVNATGELGLKHFRKVNVTDPGLVDE